MWQQQFTQAEEAAKATSKISPPRHYPFKVTEVTEKCLITGFNSGVC